MTMRPWAIAPTLRTRQVDGELVVGAWGCDGRVRDWDVEHAGELEVVLQETGLHALRRGRQEAVVLPGSAVVLGRGEEYLRNSPSPRPQRSTHLLLRGELAAALVRSPARAVIPTSARVALAQARVRRALDPLALHEGAVDLVAALCADIDGARLPAPPPRAAWGTLADSARHVLATRFREPLGLPELAARCGTSSFHLARVFRAVTGESIHRTRTRLRLRAALVALDEGPRDLGTLALELGFASHAHFTDAFRREYGCPPSRARPRR